MADPDGPSCMDEIGEELLDGPCSMLEGSLVCDAGYVDVSHSAIPAPIFHMALSAASHIDYCVNHPQAPASQTRAKHAGSPDGMRAWRHCGTQDWRGATRAQSAG